MNIKHAIIAKCFVCECEETYPLIDGDETTTLKDAGWVTDGFEWYCSEDCMEEASAPTWVRRGEPDPSGPDTLEEARL